MRRRWKFITKCESEARRQSCFRGCKRGRNFTKYWGMRRNREGGLDFGFYAAGASEAPPAHGFEQSKGTHGGYKEQEPEMLAQENESESDEGQAIKRANDPSAPLDI